ncbi:hypothetical protein [Hymenobacter sp. YC55]|uniref:hypothetical protein n=1 Tax=Hymenobacter sp. YC55 TaxID=3034019 RepID=UPI0023F96763|nr:hypothetical protein [Hymenobacter sp. YC55]MDF7815182.1 hypothetical protein [Hymenobacter sp. YC55]
MVSEFNDAPRALTPRAYVLQQLQAAHAEPYTKNTAYVHRLYAHYLAGEMSWREVCRLRDAPMYLP